MNLNLQELFTPIFIIIVVFVMICGTVFLKYLDKLFNGSDNLMTIRMFGVAIILNVIIFLFIIMSFSKIKFNRGKEGPQGNKGMRGDQGDNGGLNICETNTQTSINKKIFDISSDYIDTKNPIIEK